MELTDFLILDECGKTAYVKNWKKINLLRDEQLQEKVFDKLKQDGILSSVYANGTFYVTGCGTVMRPNLGVREFNFSTAEHAKDYQQQMYGQAQYATEIVMRV